MRSFFSPSLASALLIGCPSQPTDSGGDHGVRLEGLVQVVPSDGLPDEIVVQDANNNLDVLAVGNKVYMAWRTAPSHFASDLTMLYVVSSTDEETWSLETAIHLGTDLREPRLMYLEDPQQLFLYFAVLGTSPTAFEPQGTMYVVRDAEGHWTDPAWLREDSFIPWRIKHDKAQPQLMGYAGGDQIYDGDGELPQIDIEWLTTQDGLHWSPVVEDFPVVHTGGASEADFTWIEGGDLLVVARNEAGDSFGFGSLICTAAKSNLAAWQCSRDLKKYDSPLLFDRAGRYWLIARRNLTETGNYDLEMNDLSHQEQSLQYEAAYWGEAKRCSLWQVFPDELVALHTLDLPSRGDTCFPSALDRGEGHYTVYNYSNDVDGEDLPWNQGQISPTFIYKQELYVP
jgi:hypothetical protein